jgi:hydrogenase expression/formation protein HypD
MKYVDEYRDGRVARTLGTAIAQAAAPDRTYRFMEFCGGHTHAISRYGIADLLPGNVRMIHGPGCPVCVLPIGRIDAAIELSKRPGITLCTYADLMRVPGSRGANLLLKAKAAGADMSAWSIRRSTRSASPRANRTRESRVLRHRFRDHHATSTALAIRAGASKKRTRQFQRVL